MNQVSEFTIGKLNTILEQIQKDLGVYAVSSSLYGKRMYMVLKFKDIGNDVDNLIKIRDKIVDYFGIDKNHIKTNFTGSKKFPSLDIEVETQELTIIIEDAI